MFISFSVTLHTITIAALMNRTFAHKVSVAAVACIAICAGAALYCFLQRQGVYALCGLLVMAVAVAAVERTVHTEYVLTADGWLLVRRGRFARQLTVAVAEITRITKRHAFLHLVSYVLIEYGAGHVAVVQPADEEHFINELKKIQRQYDEDETVMHGGSDDAAGTANEGTAH